MIYDRFDGFQERPDALDTTIDKIEGLLASGRTETVFYDTKCKISKIGGQFILSLSKRDDMIGVGYEMPNQVLSIPAEKGKAKLLLPIQIRAVRFLFANIG